MYNKFLVKKEDVFLEGPMTSTMSERRRDFGKTQTSNVVSPFRI